MAMAKTEPGTVEVVLTKDERIAAERKRLTKIFKPMGKDKLAAAKASIDQMSYLAVTIQDLQHDIDVMGTLIQYDNGGGQTGVKSNPDTLLLSRYISNYNAIARTLLSQIPAGEKANVKASTDPLLEFMNS